MKRLLSLLVLSTSIAVLASPASAGDAAVGSIAVKQAWTRVTPPSAKVAGGFMTITNNGKETDRLIGGSAAIAGRLEVHEMAMDGGVMKMREVAGGLEIKPGQSVVLKPGSYHVMFMDLKSEPVAGTPVTGTLKFEKAGSVDIAYDVAPLGAKSLDDKTAGTASGTGSGSGKGGHHGHH